MSFYNPEELLKQFTELSLLEYVTKGGQKEVFAAQHGDKGKVALKILPPIANVDRFAREIEAVQSIAVNRVPAIINFGKLTTPYDDHLWLIEEWVEGVNLREKMNAGPLSNQLILQIALNLLEVFVEAESKKIVHRDIKPDNIIISLDEAQCWLVDFGIARHLDKTSLTAEFMPLTLGYAPIEQLNAAKSEVDTRCDLFSLGVTLYECVEGLNPFTQNVTDHNDVINLMRTLVLPEISRQIDVKNQFKDLITAMTRQKRNHRIGSANEALEWMKEIVAEGAL